MKFCRNCAHGYTLPDQPKNRRCRKSAAKERDDASLCGEMRKEICGPEATMWEAQDGEA